MEKSMTEYDRINREASIKYNEDLQSGNYKSAIRQLAILSDIAGKENRLHDKKRLENIAQYIGELFNPCEPEGKIKVTETKKSQRCSMLAQDP